MSKKTRKKSPQTSPGKNARAPSKASAKPATTKTRPTTTKKSGNTAQKQRANAAVKVSHQGPSKPLKPANPGASVPRAAAESKTAAAKPAAVNPASKKPLQAKAEPAATRRSVTITEGAKAPGFRLPRDGGGTVSLADYAGKKLVLFFYPRADTLGCTKEAIDFTRLAGAFADGETAVLGVSADPLKAQEAFRDRHQLSTPLVSDEAHEMLQAYGVWGEKSMYGKIFQGILRTTVLIGVNGRIAKIWRHVKVDGHADEVLAAAGDL